MATKFETKVNNLFKAFAKNNQAAHGLIIEALAHYGQHGDVSLIERFTVGAFANQKHFRYQAYKAWVHEFTGLKIQEPDEKEPHLLVKVDKNADKFTAETLARCKATPFYDFAPEDKALATPKIGESLEITMARGLNTGTITEEEIIQYAASLVAKVKAKQTDPKVVDWSIKYLEQNAA